MQIFAQCPYCGSSIFIKRYGSYAWAQCGGCDARGPKKETPNEAGNAWVAGNGGVEQPGGSAEKNNKLLGEIRDLLVLVVNRLGPVQVAEKDEGR